ncbi:MAG: CaiB/BaiF CoA-transferase family protein [Acidimicrobiia bacterium]
MRLGDTAHPERAQWGKPLDGIRVLAAEQMQALPFATQLLAHLGADVVKVEHPRHGESGRGAQPSLIDVDGREVGATYLRNNFSKRSVGIDLKLPAGRELFRRLVPHFDVVGENFKAGTMERLGLGYEELAALHPPLVYVSLSGFGNLDETPYRSWPAYASIAEAMSGLYESNRSDPDEPPVPLIAGAIGDISTALFGVIGILAALRHRDTTGLGQYVDIAMYDSMIAMADLVPFMWSMGGKPPRAGGTGLGIIDGFRAQDGWFVIQVVREPMFAKLAELIGHPEWVGDPRFATRQDWDARKEPLVRPALEAWASTRTKLEACAELCAAGVAAGPNNTASDLFVDAHVTARNMLVEMPRPDADRPMLVPGNPVKLSRVAEGPVRRFPALGEHTVEVLRAELELDDDELARLRAGGVI